MTHPDPLDIPLEKQKTVPDLIQVMENLESYSVAHVPNHNEKFEFRVPDHMNINVIDEVALPHFSSCVGRWAAEAQIADHNYSDPRFIKANLINLLSSRVHSTMIFFLS